ncbi:MAG: hypothetical protein QOE76_1079 [Frankiales bacterium]|jgi:hypothetical protein|nr:hypothetical protein [Frankiales bacterium]
MKPLRRHWHHVALLVLAVLCALAYGPHSGQSWHFFVEGSRSLFCTDGSASCGLQVYAAHPELQIGPLSFVVAAVLPGEDGAELAELVMMLAGLAALLAVEHDARATAGPVLRERLQRRVFLAGVVFVPAWADLSVRFAHLDDVLALTFTALAVRAVARGGSTSVGCLLALATLSKPWAVAFLPLAFAVPAGRRMRTVVWAVAPVAIVAGLFVAADPGTLTAARFGIPNAPSSSLRVLGVSAPTTPSWDRPAQFLAGLALGSIAVARGRWAAVVMVAAAARIALDPGVYSYYTAAILLGAVVWDVQARKGRDFPAWSWLVFGALFLCRYLPLGATTLGALRLGVCIAVVAAALFTSRPLGSALSWAAPDRAGQPEPPRRNVNAR